jgi:hypothetical protein
MKKTFALLMLVALPALAENSLEQFRVVEQGGSGVTTTASGLSCFHDADNSVSICVNTNDTTGTAIYGNRMPNDAAVPPLTVSPRQVFPGVAAANTTGANVIIAPGGGLTQITGVTQAGTAGDTLTFVVQNNDGTTSTVVLTEGAGVGQWNCAAAASDAACVANIAALVNATATLNTRVLVTYPAASETCAFTTVPGVSWFLSLTPSDAANAVVTTGTPGRLVIGMPNTSSTTPNIVSQGDLTTGIGLGRANTIDFTILGTQRLNVSGSTIIANGIGFTASTSFTSLLGTYLGTGNAGDGTTGYSMAVTKGAKDLRTLMVKTVTFSGGAGEASKSSSGLIPVGVRGTEITGYVTVTGTTCTSIDIGTAADPDLYCDNCAVAQGTTFSRYVGGLGPGYTAEPAQGQIGAAGEVLITANGGNCVSLAIRLTASYENVTADTSL